MQYRKKPVVIEAMHYDGTPESITAIFDWACPSGDTLLSRIHHMGTDDDPGELVVQTLEGSMYAKPGDWIVKEPFPTDDRRFYPVKPDIFAATYEPVGASAHA